MQRRARRLKVIFVEVRPYEKEMQKFSGLTIWSEPMTEHGRQPSEISCTDSKEQPQENLAQPNCGASEAINKYDKSGIFIEDCIKQLRVLEDTEQRSLFVKMDDN